MAENAAPRALIAAVAALLLTGCTSRTFLVPGAETVRYTKNKADISECRFINVVEESVKRDSRYCGEGCQTDLRNRTLALGGDTVLFTGRGSGMAYKCGTPAEKGAK